MGHSILRKNLFSEMANYLNIIPDANSHSPHRRNLRLAPSFHGSLIS